MTIEFRSQPYFPAISQIRPTPAKTQFSEVLEKGASGLVRGVEAGIRTLPGGSAIAVALRGGVSTRAGSGIGGGTASAEGPSASASGASGTGAGAEPGVEDSLRSAQEMNLYYLQIQEQVNAQNRTFSTLSNVLKAEHDTVKTAIGNIR